MTSPLRRYERSVLPPLSCECRKEAKIWLFQHSKLSAGGAISLLSKTESRCPSTLQSSSDFESQLIHPRARVRRQSNHAGDGRGSSAPIEQSSIDAIAEPPLLSPRNAVKRWGEPACIARISSDPTPTQCATRRSTSTASSFARSVEHGWLRIDRGNRAEASRRATGARWRP